MAKKDLIDPEKLAKAKQMLEEGCSQQEVALTLNMSRNTIRKYFPGTAWTFQQRAEHGVLVRTMNHKIKRAAAHYV
jgi:predicted transcriptional regulator